MSIIMQSVAIVAVAKDEERYLAEWIYYHLGLGVDHIYLYDNNDIFGRVQLSDPMVSVLDFSGPKPNFLDAQTELYQSAYETYGGLYDWIAFIDIDEFITVPGNDLPGFLEGCGDASLVHLNWRCYGDSGRMLYENAPVLERFTVPAREGAMYLRAPADTFVKSIVRTRREARFASQHTAWVSGYCVDGSGRQCDNGMFHTLDPMAPAYIRHYVTKSLEEYFERRLVTQYHAFAGVYQNPTERLQDYFSINGYSADMRRALIYLCGKHNIFPAFPWP